MFGERLRELRVERGMTQPDLATLLGLARSTISQYETGIRQPDIDTLKRMSDIFHVSMDYLCGRTDIREPYGEPEIQLPSELRPYFRGRRWEQYSPQSRRVIVAALAQLDAELEAEERRKRESSREGETGQTD